MPAVSRPAIFLGAVALLAAAPACVETSRADAIEASIARVRAESAQRDRVHDQQLQWLRWGQIVLAREVYGQGADRVALARRLADLEAQNAELTARLERAEQRRDGARAASPDAPARVLDENVPYDVGGFVMPAVASRPEKRPAPPARPPAAHGRRLDEAVPYDARSSDTKVFPRVLDETVPY